MPYILILLYQGLSNFGIMFKITQSPLKDFVNLTAENSAMKLNLYYILASTYIHKSHGRKFDRTPRILIWLHFNLQKPVINIIWYTLLIPCCYHQYIRLLHNLIFCKCFLSSIPFRKNDRFLCSCKGNHA